MSESRSNFTSEFEEPRFRAQVEQIRQLREQILADEVDSPKRDCLIYVNADPQAVEDRLRHSSFGKIVLPNGASLSQQPPSRQFPELGLFVGDAKPVETALRVWKLSPSDRPPTEENKSTKLSIEICYKKGEIEVWQTICVALRPELPNTPSMYRLLLSKEYMLEEKQNIEERSNEFNNVIKPNYHGHNFESLYGVQEDNVSEFLEIFDELYGKREA
jgi:hypothetical protein